MIDNISGQLIYDILLLKRKKYGGNKVLVLCVLCCQAITALDGVMHINKQKLLSAINQIVSYKAEVV